MNRAEKEQKVSELNEALSRAKFVLITDYKGLKVTEMEKLRRKLRQADSELRISKNTLLRLAARGTQREGPYWTDRPEQPGVTYRDMAGSRRLLAKAD